MVNCVRELNSQQYTLIRLAVQKDDHCTCIVCCIVEVVGRWMDVLRRTDCSTGYLSHPAVKKATRYCNTITTAPTGGAEGMYCNIITIVLTLPCSNVSVAMNPLPCSNVSVAMNPLPCSNVSAAMNPVMSLLL